MFTLGHISALVASVETAFLLFIRLEHAINLFHVALTIECRREQSNKKKDEQKHQKTPLSKWLFRSLGNANEDNSRASTVTTNRKKAEKLKQQRIAEVNLLMSTSEAKRSKKKQRKKNKEKSSDDEQKRNENAQIDGKFVNIKCFGARAEHSNAF